MNLQRRMGRISRTEENGAEGTAAEQLMRKANLKVGQTGW